MGLKLLFNLQDAVRVEGESAVSIDARRGGKGLNGVHGILRIQLISSFKFMIETEKREYPQYRCVYCHFIDG